MRWNNIYHFLFLLLFLGMAGFIMTTGVWMIRFSAYFFQILYTLDIETIYYVIWGIQFSPYFSPSAVRNEGEKLITQEYTFISNLSELRSEKCTHQRNWRKTLFIWSCRAKTGQLFKLTYSLEISHVFYWWRSANRFSGIMIHYFLFSCSKCRFRFHGFTQGSRRIAARNETPASHPL